LDNPAVAQVLREVADLLEIKGDNPFKIRAYRNAADIVANHPHEVAGLDVLALREIPGIGKDLAARIRELVDTGELGYHRELVAEFPPSVLDLLGLQGIGPKTVATLYRDLGVRTVDDLERAASEGRVRQIRGMGAKKEALILKALEERKRHAGRHLMPDMKDLAATLVDFLAQNAAGTHLQSVGSLRRGTETCGDIDILACGAEPSLMDVFVSHPLVERVLGRGETKSSVRLKDGVQADLRLVPSSSRGAAMQYFTGSKAHNIALRDRAVGQGLKLNEYGLFRTADDTLVAGDTEEGIYRALGLAWIPPELREGHGEIEAAAGGLLPALVARQDLRGDLHTHSTETDGKDDVRAMIEAAQAAGLEYVAITDHSRALAMANGLDETRALAHASRIRSLDGHQGVRVLAGIECDILADGTLDLADDCLASLDLVVASVHSSFAQDKRQMTDRLLRAIDNPWVDILGHPTGRLLLKRSPYAFDLEAVLDAAARRGVAIEINCQANRLDLCDVQARFARDRGVRLVVSSDAHSRRAFRRLDWGVTVARRAWLQPVDILNTRTFDAFVPLLRRHQR
jgi:DNA polymerase (family 10)